jgi:hypothetical protein
MRVELEEQVTAETRKLIDAGFITSEKKKGGLTADQPKLPALPADRLFI